MKKKLSDIQDREDIELLVNEFYKSVIKDDILGYIFVEVVQLDFEVHLPVMYDFWESTLLGKMKYKGNPMVKHMRLNERVTLTSTHFEQWLNLWEQNLNIHFKGPKADEAIIRATQIGAVMKYKIEQHSAKK